MDVIKNFLTVYVFFDFLRQPLQQRDAGCASEREAVHSRWLTALFTNTAKLKGTADNSRAISSVLHHLILQFCLDIFDHHYNHHNGSVVPLCSLRPKKKELAITLT